MLLTLQPQNSPFGFKHLRLFNASVAKNCCQNIAIHFRDPSLSLDLRLLYLAGEHAIAAEICGFGLLALSSLIAKFATSGIVDYKLYIAVAVFFIAGVFKVRLQLKKEFPQRVSMILYVAFAVFAYYLIRMPVIILLPLIDNAIFSITLYRIKLKATGWLEVIKGMAFLVLIALFP